MRLPVKIATWTAAGVLALIVLLISAVLVVGNTEWGRAFIVRLTPEVTQGHIHLKGIHGAFPAALDLERLELSDDDVVWSFAEQISLRWTPSALLTRHIKVDTLSIARLHIERAPLPEKKPKPSTTASVPHTDLTKLFIGTLELGSALTGEPASLTVSASAHVLSLQDATAHMVARRTGGTGDYEIQLQLDPARMEAMLRLQEPANGPLENLLKVPDLGELSVSARMTGPRSAERIQLSLDAGPLRGRAQGTADLVKRSADFAYSLIAPQMEPRPGLSWQRVDLQGHFHGPFTTPDTDGHLRIESLRAPGGTQLTALDAHLRAHADGLLALNAVVEGLSIPGPKPALFQDSALSLEA
jgi:translocation and assembly module TamB